jgi:folate-binding protein YgfZ
LQGGEEERGASLTSETGWFADPEWSYLKVTGADRVDFLHRLTTNVIPRPGEPLAHTFFLNVNARILAEMWVGAEEESLSIFVPGSQLEAAKENIDRYHFGEKIALSEPSGQLFVVVGASQAEQESLAQMAAYASKPDPRYGDDAIWFFVEEQAVSEFRQTLAQLGSELSENQAESLRLTTGRPRCGRDYDAETLFLEMAQQGDFSESKGCYPGQEIVARVLHRGRLNRHLRGFVSEVKIPGDWILTRDGKEMARVTTSVETPSGGSRGLLYVRREVGDDGTELSATGQDGQPSTLTVVPRAKELLTGDPP